MKKITFLIAVFTVAFSVQSQNLILNASAELPMVNGEIPNWTETIGASWISYDNLIDFNFEPNSTPNGTFWFYPQNSTQNINGKNVSELEQTINITSDATAIDLGSKNYFFSGFVRTFEQGLNDQSNIFIEFYDVNNVLLTEFNFGPFSDASVWSNVNRILQAPINSRIIKIKLHSVLRSGSANDGCYDDLYLGSTPPLGVSENEVAKSNINIYPNPSSGIYNINSNQNIENTTIKVIDLNGRIVHQLKAENLINKSLDLNNLHSGTYILNIENEEYKYSRKIVKQ